MRDLETSENLKKLQKTVKNQLTLVSNTYWHCNRLLDDQEHPVGSNFHRSPTSKQRILYEELQHAETSKSQSVVGEGQPYSATSTFPSAGALRTRSSASMLVTVGMRFTGGMDFLLL